MADNTMLKSKSGKSGKNEKKFLHKLKVLKSERPEKIEFSKPLKIDFSECIGLVRM